jgi:hypothetical protein
MFFESISADKSLGGWLHWELKTPGGTTVFSSFFESTVIGRKTLPETGTYTLRFKVGANDATLTGGYSFRIRPVSADNRITLRVGEAVSDGSPAAGAGRIETAGGADVYKFDGVEGQVVFFEQISAAPEFVNWLRWIIKSPGGTELFRSFFRAGQVERKSLPETGTYTIEVAVGNTGSTAVGPYSFRTWSPVVARADQIGTAPGLPVTVPFAHLLCNDGYETPDNPDVDLAVTTSREGGIVTRTSGAITYTPAAGFVGVDVFEYVLQGHLGDTKTARVTVHVGAGLDEQPVVVSVSAAGPRSARACIMATANQPCVVEESTDLANWTATNTINTDRTGAATFEYAAETQPAKFYRFRATVAP